MAHRQVFLSHALNDKPLIAERLCRALIAQGLTIWYDDAVISWGDSLPLSIQRGLSESEFVLVLITPNFVRNQTGWRYRELEAALNRQEAGIGTRILPLVWNLSHRDLSQRLPFLASRQYYTVPESADDASLDVVAVQVAALVRNARRIELSTRDEADQADPVRNRFRRAVSEICILGNDCKLVAESLSALVKEALAREVRIKVLCVDPDGLGAETLAIWDERFVNAAAFRDSMRSVEGSLKDLVQRHPGLEVRYAPFAPPFGLFIVDHGLPTSSTKVEIYTVKPFQERPHFFVPSGAWEDFFVGQWENIWSLSRRPDWSPAA